MRLKRSACCWLTCLRAPLDLNYLRGWLCLWILVPKLYIRALPPITGYVMLLGKRRVDPEYRAVTASQKSQGFWGCCYCWDILGRIKTWLECTVSQRGVSRREEKLVDASGGELRGAALPPAAPRGVLGLRQSLGSFRLTVH